jgi:hypothetical protein
VGQAAYAAADAAAATSKARPSRRGRSASRTSTHIPPARQASRVSPGGASCASDVYGRWLDTTHMEKNWEPPPYA